MAKKKENEYSKGQKIFKLKSKAQEVAKESRKKGIPAKLTKLAKGYRVDRKYDD